jgi:glycosyltransferase involved in cell wall biosynthesis
LTYGSGVNKKIFTYSPKKSEDKIIITLTARMLLEKGIKVFSEASILLKKKYFGKVEFHLFGPIDLDNPSALTETELKTLNIENYFTWKGNSENIIKVLNQTDIYCLPTHYGEGIPKSIIEAMAIGRPIITTDIPGCKKCVIEGQNGYLVPIKDPEQLSKKIEKLIKDKSLREKMGKNSRILFEKDFTLEKVVRQTFELYEKVLSN